MKNLIIGLVISVLSVTSAVGLIHDANYYALTAEIIEMDYQEDIVMVSTPTGITYTFYGCEDYYTGDIVSMVMDDRGTDFVKDDRIVNVRYSGYWME